MLTVIIMTSHAVKLPLQKAWSSLFTLLLQNISNCHVWQTIYEIKFCFFWRLGWVGTISYLIQELSKIIFVFINFSEYQSHVFLLKNIQTIQKWPKAELSLWKCKYTCVCTNHYYTDQYFAFLKKVLLGYYLYTQVHKVNSKIFQ